MSLLDNIDFDCGLLGVIPIKIVTNISHAVGNVAVGHSVGKGVRIFQRTQTNNPDQISFNGVLIGRNRFLDKFALWLLSKSPIAFPFVSRLVTLPLVTITGIVFHQRSDRRDTGDKLPVIDFSVTLMEHKVPLLSLAAQVAWVAWATNTLPEPASGRIQQFQYDPDENTAETVINNNIGNVYIETDTKDILDYEEVEFTDIEWEASRKLDIKYKGLPIDISGNFPQTIKIQFPPDNPTDFVNNFNVVPYRNPTKHNQTDLYKFPSYTVNDRETYLITFKIKENIQDVLDLYVEIKNLTEDKFIQYKVVPEYKYTFGNLQFAFKEIDIVKDKDNNTIRINNIQGGVRYIQ